MISKIKQLELENTRLRKQLESAVSRCHKYSIQLRKKSSPRGKYDALCKAISAYAHVMNCSLDVATEFIVGVIRNK